MKYKIIKNEELLFVGSSERIRERIESMLEDKLDFFIMLQEEIAEDNNLEIFVHSETYEYLEEQQEDKILKLGITDDISKDEICKYLGINILNEYTYESIIAGKTA